MIKHNCLSQIDMLLFPIKMLIVYSDELVILNTLWNENTHAIAITQCHHR